MPRHDTPARYAAAVLGGAGAVPIIHKSAAVSEVIAQLAIEADEDPE